jgi:hypothetical protein
MYFARRRRPTVVDFRGISAAFSRVHCEPVELHPRGGGSERCAAAFGELYNADWVFWGRYEDVRPDSFRTTVQLVPVSAPEAYRAVVREFSRSGGLQAQARTLWRELVRP